MKELQINEAKRMEKSLEKCCIKKYSTKFFPKIYYKTKMRIIAVSNNLDKKIPPPNFYSMMNYNISFFYLYDEKTFITVILIDHA